MVILSDFAIEGILVHFGSSCAFLAHVSTSIYLYLLCSKILLKISYKVEYSDVVVSRLALSFQLMHRKDQGAWEQDYTDYHSKGVWYPCTPSL